MENSSVGNNTIADWRRIYEVCKSSMQKKGSDDIAFNSPASLASVGLKFFSPELNSEEEQWCVKVIIEIAEFFIVNERERPFMAGLGKYSITNKEPALKTLPILLSLKLSNDQKEIIEELIVSLLHEISIDDGINKPIFNDVCGELWRQNDALAKQCFNSFVKLGIMDYDNEPETGTSIKHTLNYQVILPDQYVFFTKYMNRLYLDKAYLMITEKRGLESESVAFLYRYLDFLMKQTFEIPKQSYNSRQAHQTYFGADSNFRSKFGKVILEEDEAIAKGLFGAVLDYVLLPKDATIEHLTEKSLDFACKCVEQVIRYQDIKSNNLRFNKLWTILSNRTSASRRMVFVDQLFLNISWKDGATNWEAIKFMPDLYKGFIILFGRANPSAAMKLMSGIGFDDLFPDSIELVWKLMQYHNAGGTYDICNLQSYDAEKYVQRAFFFQGNRIRTNKELRLMFVGILDFMIISGSSIAYLIKENISSVSSN